MKAMILAAGEGRRMRPLTLTTPKPLLQVGGRALLEHHLLNLKASGFTHIVVNAAYLGRQIIEFCGDGSQWGLSISVSLEGAPLETAGGILNAMALLGDDPFLVVNGDVWMPYPFGDLQDVKLTPAGAHLVLVDNPAHNVSGDFSLAQGAVQPRAENPLTFSGVALYDPAFFQGCVAGFRPLKPLLDQAIERGVVTGEQWLGAWQDVGTPERLASLDAALQARQGN